MFSHAAADFQRAFEALEEVVPSEIRQAQTLKIGSSAPSRTRVPPARQHWAERRPSPPLRCPRLWADAHRGDRERSRARLLPAAGRSGSRGSRLYASDCGLGHLCARPRRGSCERIQAVQGIDRVDNRLETEGMEQVERVLCSGQLRVYDRARGGARQCLGNVSGARDGDQRVSIAVRDKEGRRSRSDVSER